MEFVKRNTGLGGIILFIIGIFFSRALLSISVALIFIQPFLIYSLKEIFNKIIRSRLSLLFIIYYVSIALTWFVIENKSGYTNDIRIKLPMLLLPFGLICDDLYRKRNLIIIMIMINAIACLVGIVSFINYVAHFSEFNELIIQSKPIPIFPGDKIGHIYYSFILAFAIISSVILHLKKITGGVIRSVNIVITIINVALIHIIGARTGLLAFYFSAFVLLIAWGIIAGKYLPMAIIIISIFIAGTASVRFIPSLHNRYLNTLSDLKIYRHGDNFNGYSISMRMAAWGKTFEIIKEHPIAGVGYANVLPEIKKHYRNEGSKLTDENQKEPHNQFLEIFAASGIIGFLIFIILFFQPLHRIFSNKDYLSLGLMSVMFITFNVESALEMQIGASYFAFMWIYVNSLSKEFLANNMSKL